MLNEGILEATKTAVEFGLLLLAPPWDGKTTGFGGKRRGYLKGTSRAVEREKKIESKCRVLVSVLAMGIEIELGGGGRRRGRRKAGVS